MRVFLASRIYSPEPAAAAFRLRALARALAADGHSVTVLTTRTPSGDAGPADPSVDVRRAPVLRDATGYVRGYVQYMSFDIPLLFRLLFANRPDVIVAEPPPTTGFVVRLVSALRRVPFVYYAADIWSDAAESTGAPGWVVAVVRRLEAGSLKRASRVIAVSDGVAERVRQLAPTATIEVVTNGVDTTTFTPDGTRLADAPLAVYAGTTSEWQGADVFIRSMPTVLEQIPEARLVFVGQGSAWQSLRELARRLDLDAVEFRDVVPPEEAAVLLRSARVALVSLQPGQGYDFAVPTKIFAAAACGTPVLFAGTGAAADLISAAGIGSAPGYDDHRVGLELLSMLRVPVPDARRTEIQQWAERNVSAAATARKAAAVVLSAVAT
ncbi:MAG: glycosyltransferase family 4 protein [Leifsonia flava]